MKKNHRAKYCATVIGVVVVFLCIYKWNYQFHKQNVHRLNEAGVYQVSLGGGAKELEVLLKNGGNVNQIGPYGESALATLIASCDGSDPENVRKADLLLQYGADPNQTHRGVSLIEVARRRKLPQFISLLQRYRANEH